MLAPIPELVTTIRPKSRVVTTSETHGEIDNNCGLMIDVPEVAENEVPISLNGTEDLYLE